MKKYLTYFRTSIAVYFAYRLSFFLWRVRNVLGFIIIYFLWDSVYSSNQILFSYTKEQMITYVLGVNLANAIIISSRTSDIASEIVQGDIINYLLKPFPFFSFVITKELADKAINGVFAVIELIIFYFLVNPRIFIQPDLAVYPFVFMALVIGATIAFFLSLSLSFAAFWTPEVWAPRFIYFIFISLLAGTIFPLDILPKPLFDLILLTPFPYLMYLPIKIYLTGITPFTLTLFAAGITWAIAFYFIAKIIWNRGIKQFSFFGR